MIDRCMLHEILIDMNRMEVNIILFASDALKRSIAIDQDCVQNNRK
jgi:hypothetical protein